MFILTLLLLNALHPYKAQPRRVVTTRELEIVDLSRSVRLGRFGGKLRCVVGQDPLGLCSGVAPGVDSPCRTFTASSDGVDQRLADIRNPQWSPSLRFGLRSSDGSFVLS